MLSFTSSPLPLPLSKPRFDAPFRNPRAFHSLKKRRRKSKPLRNALDPSSSTSFLPLDWLPPAAAAALAIATSAVALRLRNPNPNSDAAVSKPQSSIDIGEWILFTNPSPFNRFVLLRCPSISFDGGDYDGGLSDRLVKERKHYVRLDSGRIRVTRGEEGENEGMIIEYQRECVVSGDGGVIALDWPANLDLSEEYGLDTVVLLIPGTEKGSSDLDVRAFVRDCLRRGLFPVVFNPRGCAGSPLTTPRLFTAADSDDINSAIRFITRERPWSTLMSVGWGYGANMLTKYLAEAGEKTPLTAATCINNPFDLDEATRTAPYSTGMDETLIGGLKDILRANKEIFQGRRKGFDVEKALSAESVRDFEEAISMVSHGFDSIEEFYENSSTRCVVDQLKIPVLFVQDDDGTVPLFSIPRTLIAENPFTSLLLCSCVPSNITAISWYQQVTIEWLMAVELGLLKGRHPLLQDMDVTINPSKGLALVEGRTSETDDTDDNVLNLTEHDSPMKGLLKGGNLNSNKVSRGIMEPKEIRGVLPQTALVDSNSVEDVDDNPAESDEGQVLQTTQVVMKMLDVTMPGTLKEEEKKKVLKAVGQGETLVKALQDAVPEDVRGKLTNSVSEILQSQGENLNFDALRSVNHIADVSSPLQSNIKQDTTEEYGGKPDYNEHKVNVNDNRDSKAADQHDTDKPAEVGAVHSEEKPPESSDVLESKSDESHSDSMGSEKAPIEPQKSDDNLDGDLSSEEGHEGSDNIPQTGFSNQNADSSDLGESGSVHNSGSRDVETNELEVKQSYMTESVGDKHDSPDEQSVTSEADDIKLVDTSEKPVLPDQNRASVIKNPTFNVTQALDALSGLDDSTQVAVNSVFGVIEDMITQYEERKSDGSSENENENENENNDAINQSVTEKTKTSSRGDDMNGTPENDGDGNTGNYLTAATGRKKDMDSESNGFPLYQKMDPFTEAFYNECLQKYGLSKMQKMKPLYVDKNTTLCLDYNPEEGNWLLMEQPEGDRVTTPYRSINHIDHGVLSDNRNSKDEIIEPSYVILDAEKQEKPSEEELMGKFDVNDDYNIKDSSISAKTVVLDALKVAVSRRVTTTDMEEMEAELEADLEEVANAVYFAVQHHKGNDQKIIEAISVSVQNTGYLKRVLPVGVIVGSSLAALRSFIHDHGGESLDVDPAYLDGFEHELEIEGLSSDNNLVKDEGTNKSITSDVDYGENGNADTVKNDQLKSLNKDTLMVGAVTAALGASALFSTQQTREDLMGSDNISSSSSLEMESMKKDVSNMVDSENAKHQSNNIITSLAEKAMSVAAPVVPTKEGGEVDQERIVAMLAELGQKGGMLKLVGKLALLWGGLRSAMSLTDRLISFLHLSERPLLQRVLGFSGMVLVLWSPVLVPLLPTLFHSWATQNTSRIAELACILGLYAAVTILILQWGRRIRGHEFPLKQYGLDFSSPKKTQEFLTGLVGGIALVICIESVNVLLGFVNISLPSSFVSSSLDLTAKMKVYGQLILLAGQGIITAAAVSLVEELLFRSWLLEEIAADLGYHPAIILSGLAFSLSQRSLVAIPGLWLLSICLSGARLRTEGSLFITIGMRTGIMSLSYILHMSGFLIYQPKLHHWIGGVHSLQPFAGIVGLVSALLLAMVLYPRQHPMRDRFRRIIRA